MVLPELSSGVWIGIGFGIIGISFWIIGLVLFDRLVDRFRNDPHDEETEV